MKIWSIGMTLIGIGDGQKRKGKVPDGMILYFNQFGKMIFG